MFEVLPSWYPIVRLPAVVLLEVGEGFVEIFGVDVGEYLPEYLAIFELGPGCYPAGEVECVDLESYN